MNADDQTLAVAVSTLALALFLTFGLALQGGDVEAAKNGYGIKAPIIMANNAG